MMDRVFNIVVCCVHSGKYKTRTEGWQVVMD